MFSPRPGNRTICFWAVWLLILASCRGMAASPTTQGQPASIPSEAASTSTLVYLLATSTRSAPATSVAAQSTRLASATPLAGPAPTPVPDPLRFVFPTPGPQPESAWRPPLYPVPWVPTTHDHFYFSRPIAADEINSPSQNYRYGGEFFADEVHTGVDIPADLGTPVLAAGSGKVIWAGYGVYRGGYDPNDPYGLAVVIRHDFGYQDQDLYTVYGHLEQVDVAEGQHVEMSQPIGLVGQTGRVTGPHLHFEIRLGDNTYFNTRNPELWIAPPQGWGVLAGQIMDSNHKLVNKQPVIVTSRSTNDNWSGRSYGPAAVNTDAYYRENVVVGDLPAGRYLIRIDYAGVNYAQEVLIYPGQVSYFYFAGRYGIYFDSPPGESDLTSPLVTPTP